MERGASRLLAFAATISSSLLAAVALTVVTRWGGDDLGAFVFWTIPFAGAVALAAPGLARILRGRLALLAPLAGALVGTGWTMVVAFLLGPYFLAFGFSVWIAWMLGGAAGLTVAAYPHPRLLRAARIVSLSTLAVVVLTFVLVPLLFWVFEPGADLVAYVREGTPDGQVTNFVQNVVLGQPGVVSVTQNDPLVLEIELADDATDEEREQVRQRLEEFPLVERVED